MTGVEAIPRPAPAATRPRPPALLLGLGTAVPTRRWSQEAIAARLEDVWRLRGSAVERWRRIVRGCGIDARHTVAAVDEVAALTTAERMEAYERHAPPLAAAAAVRALGAAGVEAEDITDLIVVSCTGFAAPGLDVALVRRLGLRPGVRRTVVGFMGCFGAISGLRVATATCGADPHATALVVCLELCSLHLRPDPDIENQVASALFADGAAAAVVTGGATVHAAAGGGVGALGLGATRLLERTHDWMTWRITDHGFAMTLSRRLPDEIRRRVSAFVESAEPDRPASIIVHPGGPEIIDAVAEGSDRADEPAFAAARDVLRRHGNMSSPTLLFVLAEALQAGCPLPGLLLAFGPGLTIESLPVRPVVAS